MNLPTLAGALLATVLWSPFLAHGADTPADPLPRRGVLGLALVPGPEGRPLVQGVAPGGAAERSGLAAGDVITSAQGRPVRDVSSLLAIIATVKAGESVAVGLDAPGRPATVQLTAGAAPKEHGEAFRTAYGSVQAKGLRLRRLLTVPAQGQAPYPTLMIVQGLGCFSVDNEAPQDPSYRPIIEALSRQGYATLRIDKPGTGDSEGAPCAEVDFETELAGYRAGLASLYEDPRVDPKQVFVFGHSMGGIMMPSLIRGHHVAGAIVYGTGFKSWLQYQLDSVRRQKALEGASLPDVEKAAREAEHLVAHLFVMGWSLDRYRKAFTGAAAAHSQGESLFAGKPVRYFQQLHAHVLPAEWAQTDTRVLAVYGGSDFVSFEDDHRGVVDAVNAVHPGQAQFKVQPRTDHWFRRAADFADSRRQAGSGPYNDEMIRTIEQWLASARR